MKNRKFYFHIEHWLKEINNKFQVIDHFYRKLLTKNTFLGIFMFILTTNLGSKIRRYPLLKQIQYTLLATHIKFHLTIFDKFSKVLNRTVLFFLFLTLCRTNKSSLMTTIHKNHKSWFTAYKILQVMYTFIKIFAQSHFQNVFK